VQCNKHLMSPCNDRMPSAQYQEHQTASVDSLNQHSTTEPNLLGNHSATSDISSYMVCEIRGTHRACLWSHKPCNYWYL